MKAKLIAVLASACLASGCVEDSPAVVDGDEPSVPPAAMQNASEDIIVKPGEISGTGCRSGTFQTRVTTEPDETGKVSNNHIMSVLFTKYRLMSDDQPATQSIKCIIEFNVTARNGKRFALKNVLFRGYARLEPGARAVADLSYGYKTAPVIPTRVDQKVFDGPRPRGITDSTDWQFQDAKFEPLKFSPCNASRIIQLTTELHLFDPNQTPGSGISMDEAISWVGSISGPQAPRRSITNPDSTNVVIELAEEPCDVNAP